MDKKERIKGLKLFYLIICLCYFISPLCSATSIFTYRSASNNKDSRFLYDTRLLQLALEKTIADYGDFNLQPSPEMNLSRAIRELESATFDNFFILLSYKKEYLQLLNYVPIPAQRGIVGYRLFITSVQGQQKLSQVNSLDMLRNLSMVQGQSWLDVEVLKHNGFNVITLSAYENMFEFIGKHRADIFPRGLNEFASEFEQYKQIIPNLRLDEKFAIHYTFPRFFFTHKSNSLGLQRIEEGLKRAWLDGAFLALWKSFYQASIDKANLGQRRIFEISNPDIESLTSDIDQYMYKVPCP